MKLHALLAALLMLPAMDTLAGTRESLPADKELLKMIDLLSDWEVIQDMDKLKRMEQVGREGQRRSRPGTRAPAPSKSNEAGK